MYEIATGFGVACLVGFYAAYLVRAIRMETDRKLSQLHRRISNLQTAIGELYFAIDKAAKGDSKAAEEWALRAHETARRSAVDESKP